MKRLSAVALAALTGCGSHATVLVTQPLERRAIDQSVTATGNLNPQDTILVGSQVSGTVQNIYVDYNSVVHKGEVLAQLDPSTFQAAVDQGKATLESAKATAEADRDSVRQAQADVATATANVHQAQSALALAEKTYGRDTELLQRGFVAQSAVDADTNVLDSAHAALDGANSAVRSSRAKYTSAGAAATAADRQVDAAVAAVAQAQFNLDHATIVAPVDGTVIQRNVSVGQTVAAALAAPTLFTIARDLSHMELDVSVGEPDVGALHAGQAVRFTVLAFPGREFSGTVAQVRQNPTIVSNVTTYDTVAYIDNHEGLLRPGMTANASIIIKHFDDALIAPLAALQWRPTPAIAKEYGLNPPHGSPSPGHAAAASQWGAVGSTNTGAVSPGGTGRVWVKRDDTIAPVTVRILAVDGANVAIEPVNGTLSPADAIVVNASK